MIDIKKETAERMKDVAPKEVIFQLFSAGLITEQAARKFLIIDEYARENPQKGTKIHVKERLADKFCVSNITVIKYISEQKR